MLTKLRLFFKTRVSGYYTQDGKWVDVHYDKRPAVKPEVKHPRQPAQPEPAASTSQLNLLSVLDTPASKRAVPKRAARQVRADADDQLSDTEPDKSALRSSEQSENIRTSEHTTQDTTADHVGLDYSQEWAKFAKRLPAFGAQEDWKPAKRKKANEAALEIIEHVKGVVTGQENRPLTTDEMVRRLHRVAKTGDIPTNWRAKLAAYSGQGGVGDSLNEYYTSPAVAAAMWSILTRLGLKSGRVLEPSAGTGVFQETKPADVTMTAVEWDKTALTINRVLHPDDDVIHSALEDLVTADSIKYDAVIGNVPFGVRGAILAHDKPDLKTAEEYFVDTALDKTKDGGVASLIVPHGIATNATARSYRDRLMRKAEVIAVHRLPNTAFAHSGTSVVTDILVLRKRPQDVAGALSVLDAKDLKDLGVWDKVWLDGKILEDPARGQMCGTAHANWRGGLDVTGSMEGVPEKVATASMTEPPEGPTYADIQQHLADRPDVLKRAQGAAKKNPYPELATGTTRLINGVLYILQGEPRRWHRADEIGPGVDYAEDSKEGRALALAGQIKKLTERQMQGETLVSDKTRQRVLELVQEYVAECGNPSGDKVLIEMGQRDPRFLPLIAAVDGNGKASPLLQGTVTGSKPVDLDTQDFDAVMAHLLQGDRRAWTVAEIAVNWDGAQSDEKASREREVLATLYASDQYAVSLDGQSWGSREDCCSGDLYPKLDALKAAVPRMKTDDPLRHKLEQQIQWLEQTVDPKTMEEFEVSLRSSWVPLPMLSEFLTEKAREKRGDGKDVRIEVSYKDGVYSIKSAGEDQGWVSQIYEKYLNRLPLKEDQWQEIPDLEREYHSWLAASSHREALENLYNRLYNGFRAKRYGESPIAMPGWNPERTLNAYQYPALRWAAEEGRGIIAYNVGLGKTAWGIALVKLLKEQGEAKRPVIVCPKSLTANWSAEIQAFAPGSSVLIIGETHTRDKNGKLRAVPDSKAERDKKWHMLAQGNYDYCLVTYPAFNDVDVDPLVKGDYIEKDFWVQRGKQLDQATPRHVREIEERYQQAMADKDFRKRTNAIYWNDLGIDCLIVDEFHAFKNLFTARDRFGGQPKYLGGSGFAKRALDMQHKMKWLREHNNNRGVYGLTATPTKNSPLEVYSMLSHIVPEAFESKGIRNSEDFIDRYCDIQPEMVLGTDGEIGPASVVKGFKNMNELRQVMGRYIYRKTAADVGLVIPEQDVHEHYVPMTKDQERIYGGLREQARTMKDENNTDVHIFSVMDKMNKAALDPALLDAGWLKGVTDTSSPKYAEAVNTIKRGLQDGGQVVFIDNLEAHQRLKKMLVEAGIPDSEIGVINAQVASDSVKRQTVADDYVSGKLKIVIGNTATMGEGVNLQTFTSDVHHLDIPWDPSSIQQRNGRGVRQGNKRQSVRVHTYLAKQSFDGYRFQTCAGKKDWMDQLWHGGDRIGNLAAEQGTIGRDDFLIMMADDPDKARADLATNKERQIEKYKAVKHTDANQTFQALVGLRRNYAALENKDTKSAQALANRIDRLGKQLQHDEYFPHKDLLKIDKPILLNQQGKGFYEGATFTLADRSKAPLRFGGEEAKTWTVTGINLDSRKVTMRPVGVLPSTDYGDSHYTCKIDDLSTGLEPTEPVSVIQEVKAAIQKLKHVKHLAIYPTQIVEAMEPEIQATLREKMAKKTDYTGDHKEWMEALWALNERGQPTKVSSGETRAKTAEYILPIPKYERRLAELASKEKKDAAMYRSASYGRRSRYENHYHQDALNSIFGYERAHKLIEDYEASTKQPTPPPPEEPEDEVSVKATPFRWGFVFAKGFRGHLGRPGLRGGSQPRYAPDTGAGGRRPDDEQRKDIECERQKEENKWKATPKDDEKVRAEQAAESQRQEYLRHLTWKEFEKVLRRSGVKPNTKEYDEFVSEWRQYQQQQEEEERIRRQRRGGQAPDDQSRQSP